ncbi:hypothetical protein SAVIM40S_08195 [Streptomyces avidinii]
MFHFSPKPSPPESVGRVTPVQAVDSSAIVTTPGQRRYTVAFISWRKPTASRFSRPPCSLGAHSPSLRE